MNDIKRLPNRDEVAESDTWDLSKLYPSDDDWETAFGQWESRIDGYEAFRGTLSESPNQLAECLAFDSELERLGERLGNYAYLRTTEDQTNSHYQRMIGRFQNVATRAGEASSYIRPEILAIDEGQWDVMIDSPELAPYRLLLERLVRYRPHTLTSREEELLAMQGEMAGATSKIFRQLHDADLKFGFIENEQGDKIELTPSTFSQLLISPEREVRKNAFHQFYEQFTAHENSLSAILCGSIQKDVYYARARGYESAREKALFADKVPASVYDNLIASVRKNLPALHSYYDLRRRKMQLDSIHHYDTYVPILSDLEVEHSWDQAVDMVCESLQPLGTEYCETLRKGLSGRWCDRYPNQGKQSGAFSYGTYDGDPYIMMNYKPRVLNDVFTLAHEAGHSMHSYFSSQHQPFEYYNYTIFVAEVASTFNEQLLTQHLLSQATDDRQKAYLLNNEIDDIRGTIIRQTMFAEFEKITHEMCEAGEPLTVEAFKSVYQGLLKDYFGPDFVIDEQLSLECLRIPHFYRAFYVYKYATGLSAAIALSQRVLQGGEQELNDYLAFLKGGCSKYPLDLLRDAGVDLEQPEPVDTALRHFASLVGELETLL
ncbi:MAG: oligoendopeptidase F [Planctomycetota bacterium]|nr:oligoendopeptidase F [Planctomycetota bacterium]